MTDIRYSYDGASTLPQCAWCGRQPNNPCVIRGECVYCNDNCAMHAWTERTVNALRQTIERGGGGAPKGLLMARSLLSDLERLQPVLPRAEICEQCWASTAPAETVQDGEIRKVRRCGLCGWEGVAS